MTLSELSLRNAKRQAADYLVYFVTIIMAAALLYAFNGLVFSGEIRELYSMMSSLPMAIVPASLVVVCICGWLVSYAANFMLTRRSRELGTYILIGLENRQVARLFFLENLAVGGCALVLGLLIGNLLFQALRAMILALFEMPYVFSLAVSLPAAGLTLAYFLLIYLLALYKSRKRIREMKIYDLIYFDRQNEEAVIRTGRNRRRMFALSIVFGIVGTFLLMIGNLLLGIIGAGCVIFFLYGFFLTFASGVPAFFEKHPAGKYRGQNLLVFRTLTAKLGTMGMVMATISLLLTATLIALGTGLVFRGIFDGRAAEHACFDLYIGAGEKGRPVDQAYLDYIEGNIPVEQSLTYEVRLHENNGVRQYLDDCGIEYFYTYRQDPVIRYSDYAALRAVAGYPAAKMEPGQYLIHCIPYLSEPLEDFRQPITAGGRMLAPGGVYTEHLIQRYAADNGQGYILVVPDEAAAGCALLHHAYAAKTVRPVGEEQVEELFRISNRIAERERGDTYDSDDYDTVYASVYEEKTAAYMTALTVLPLYYLALALTMTAATILTIQQLGESRHYRRQFALLDKMGMDAGEMAKALRTQFAIYYAMPAVPPLLIGIPFILNLAKQPEPEIMVGLSSPAAIVAIALGVFFLVYAVYIGVAYISLKKNVLPER